MKTRNKFFAGLFNLFFPGLGFLYIGRLKLALMFPVLLWCVICIGAWLRLIIHPVGFLTLVVTALLVFFGGIYLAVEMASQQTEKVGKWFQKWYIYIAFIVIFVTIGEVLLAGRAQLLGYETFRISAGSMQSTLIRGDYIISNTWAYKGEQPQRGDVAVLRYSKNDPSPYVVRVIGLPGEEVELLGAKIMIDGKQILEPYIDPANNTGELTDFPSVYLVPDGHYFVLSDNRDLSIDSRRRGYVPLENITGKTEFIFYSYSLDSTHGIRKERIGQVVE